MNEYEYDGDANVLNSAGIDLGLVYQGLKI